MKTRTGFVSNSSSSSFIVSATEKHDYSKNPKPQLSESDTKKLLDYGFRTMRNNDRSPPFEYRYDVLCNESDVIEFLLKTDIPFEAECHYGHYHVFYFKNKDLVIEAWNYGCEISTYGPDMIVDDYLDETSKNRKQSIEKFTRQQYLDHIKY